MPATKDTGVHGIGEGGPGVSAGCPEGEPVTMPATKNTGTQPVAVGFQCCSCCGQPGRKSPTCSCMKKTGNRHQCLTQMREAAEKQHQKKVIRSWVFFVFSMVVQPEKILQKMRQGPATSKWTLVNELEE